MMSHKMKLVFLSLVLLSPTIFAKENDRESIFDIRTLNCEKFVGLSEQNRDYMFFFMYGFSSGVDKGFKHSVRKIEKAVEILGNTCSINPDANVLEVLESMK